jgi:MFS family permease
VFWAVFEIASIASQSVFGALINDVVPRELLGRFYGLFRAVSLIDAIIFNYWIMGKVPAHYTLILVIIGVFYGVAFMLVCFKIKEGEYPPPAANPQPAGGVIAGFGHGARTYFRECFKSPYYLLVFVMTNFAGLAFMPINTFSIPYAASLGVNMDLYGKCMAFTFVISLLLSYFLGWLADLFHPLRMAIVFLALYVVVGIWGTVSAITANTFLFAWVLHIVVSGCYFTSAATLGQRLYPQSRFAQFASASGILGSLGFILLSPVVGSLIDLTGKCYRLTFAAGGLFALIALAVSFFVYNRFMGLGGPKHYVAPE